MHLQIILLLVQFYVVCLYSLFKALCMSPFIFPAPCVQSTFQMYKRFCISPVHVCVVFLFSVLMFQWELSPLYRKLVHLCGWTYVVEQPLIVLAFVLIFICLFLALVVPEGRHQGETSHSDHQGPPLKFKNLLGQFCDQLELAAIIWKYQ